MCAVGDPFETNYLAIGFPPDVPNDLPQSVSASIVRLQVSLACRPARQEHTTDLGPAQTATGQGFCVYRHGSATCQHRAVTLEDNMARAAVVVYCYAQL